MGTRAWGDQGTQNLQDSIQEGRWVHSESVGVSAEGFPHVYRILVSACMGENYQNPGKNHNISNSSQHSHRSGSCDSFYLPE